MPPRSQNRYESAPPTTTGGCGAVPTVVRRGTVVSCRPRNRFDWGSSWSFQSSECCGGERALRYRGVGPRGGSLPGPHLPRRAPREGLPSGMRPPGRVGGASSAVERIFRGRVAEKGCGPAGAVAGHERNWPEG
ncbi:hypothetical protein B0H17DRAFT_1087098 [Mycena rosella]|uniref:Uncharacterized protein n=1 Tax=Mycena rosella TaxID=1033263 RepID=A0AAD7G9J5_MYCRO|nr:hypothetical protein B0H17DRAFT_1087098 [Mycena rosella]